MDYYQRLTVSSILEYVNRYHGHTPLVEYSIIDNCLTFKQSYTYSEFYTRCCKVAQLLLWKNKMNRPIATLCCNSFVHLELCYATCGIGAVFHPINPKLELDTLVYILNKAEDTLLFYERVFQSKIDTIRRRCKLVSEWICIEDSFELLLDLIPESFEWPEDIQEKDPAILYFTSGRSSKPKGVVFRHRDILLSSLVSIAPDGVGLSATDSCLVFPSFYLSCCWNLIFMIPLVGAKMVLIDDFCVSDRFLQLCCEMIQEEQVSFAAAIPTFWTYFLEYLKKNQYQSRFRCLPLAKILTAGESMYPLLGVQFKEFEIHVINCYGSLETQFSGIYSNNKHKVIEEDKDLFLDRLRPLYGISIKIDEEDLDTVNGEIYIQSLWNISKYVLNNESALVNDWLPTGDIGILDKNQFLTILERKKDIVKLNGTWISSILLENIARSHPNILQAACLSIYDSILGDLCIIVCKTKEPMLETDLLKLFLERQYSPSYILFLEHFPMTSNDRIDKESLKQIVYNVFIRCCSLTSE